MQPLRSIYYVKEPRSVVEMRNYPSLTAKPLISLVRLPMGRLISEQGKSKCSVHPPGSREVWITGTGLCILRRGVSFKLDQLDPSKGVLS